MASDPKGSQYKKAYESIRTMIVEQTIKPGFPIWETDLAEQLGMSRTPIREALQRLRSEGLVYQIKSRGLFVRILSSEEIEHNYQLTEALESMVAFLLASQKNEQAIDALSVAVNGMEAALLENDVDKWTKSDEYFHASLLQYCENTAITDILIRTNILIQNVRFRYTRVVLDRKKSTEYHRRLLEAIRAGEADQARSIWQEHLEDVQKTLKQFL